MNPEPGSGQGSTESAEQAVADTIWEIRDEIVDTLPDDFQFAELVVDMIASAGRAKSAYRDASGQDIPFDLPGPSFERLAKLRHLMADPEYGAWYAVRLQIAPDDEHEVEFDYDHRPDLGDVPHDAFRKDLERYPRSPEHLPAWLTEDSATGD